MASASNTSSPGNDNEKEMESEATSNTNGDLEANTLPEAENSLNSAGIMTKAGKSAILENGQHGAVSLNDEKKDDEKHDEKSLQEKLNGAMLDDKVKVEKSGNISDEKEKIDDKKCVVPGSNGSDVVKLVKTNDDKHVDDNASHELLLVGGIGNNEKTADTATEVGTEAATKTNSSISEKETTEYTEKSKTTETITEKGTSSQTTTITASTDVEKLSAPETDSEKSSVTTTPSTTITDEIVKTEETQGNTFSNTPTKSPMGNNSTGGTAPPLSQANHSPRNGSPERSHDCSGGCHKFPDEESKAEYMKIKSEVTGEAETSDSDNEEEPPEHLHHGSHSSPDAKTKAEYRKIKYEVTGEALTSESEDENPKEGETQQTSDEPGKEEENDEWTDVFGNGLLKRKVLREGKGRDTRPDRSQIVMIQTAGRLDDGTAVDWNQSLEFILGEGEVIQVWDVGVALMELNEVCQLVTDARYAYGEQGRQGENPIPPNARITYEIELLVVRDGPDMDTMSDEERIKIGEKKKELGNDLFARGDFSGAINCYQRAIKYLTPSSDENVQGLRLKCWNNLAATQIKIKAYSAALSSCQQVLDLDPDNVKALFRKGKVLAAQGELKEAVSFVKTASMNEPGNKTIRTELTNLRRQLNSQTQQERNMYERMVGGLTEKDNKTSKPSIFPWSLVFGATVVAFGGIVAALYVTRH